MNFSRRWLRMLPKQATAFRLLINEGLTSPQIKNLLAALKKQ